MRWRTNCARSGVSGRGNRRSQQKTGLGTESALSGPSEAQRRAGCARATRGRGRVAPPSAIRGAQRGSGGAESGASAMCPQMTQRGGGGSASPREAPGASAHLGRVGRGSRRRLRRSRLGGVAGGGGSDERRRSRGGAAAARDGGASGAAAGSRQQRPRGRAARQRGAPRGREASRARAGDGAEAAGHRGRLCSRAAHRRGSHGSHSAAERRRPRPAVAATHARAERRSSDALGRRRKSGSATVPAYAPATPLRARVCAGRLRLAAGPRRVARPPRAGGVSRSCRVFRSPCARLRCCWRCCWRSWAVRRRRAAATAT